MTFENIGDTKLHPIELQTIPGFNGLPLPTSTWLQPEAPVVPANVILLVNDRLSANSSVAQVFGADATASETGFFIDTKGDLVTAYHLIKDVEGPITVITQDGIPHAASLIGSDPKTDVAILSVDTESRTQALSLNTAEADLRTGDSVVAVGHAGGSLDVSNSAATVNGMSTTNPDLPMLSLNMTSGSDDGSPILNGAGQVIGMKDGGDSTQTFALPAASIVALAANQPDAATGLSLAVEAAGRNSNIDYSSSLPSSTNKYNLDFLAIGAGVFLPELRPLSALGAGFGLAMGARDLYFHDARALYNAYEQGSPRSEVRSAISVAGDGLLVCGGVASFIPALRPVYAGISLSGSLVKTWNRDD